MLDVERIVAGVILFVAGGEAYLIGSHSLNSDLCGPREIRYTHQLKGPTWRETCAVVSVDGHFSGKCAKNYLHVQQIALRDLDEPAALVEAARSLGWKG